MAQPPQAQMPYIPQTGAYAYPYGHAYAGPPALPPFQTFSGPNPYFPDPYRTSAQPAPYTDGPDQLCQGCATGAHSYRSCPKSLSHFKRLNDMMKRHDTVPHNTHEVSDIRALEGPVTNDPESENF